MQILIANAKKAEMFSQIFQNLKGMMIDTVTFRFSKDRLFIQGMDGSHVALYELFLDKYWFDAYKFEEGDLGTITISQDILERVLSMRQKNQIIKIDYSGNPDKLNIEFKNLKPTEKEFPKEFCLPLMEVESDLLEIPDVEYEVDFSISAKTFNLLMAQMINFDEDIKMEFSEEKIRFTASGDSLGSMKVDLFSNKVEYVEEYSIAEGSELNSSFSIKYFNAFCKFDKLSSKVNLHFSENYPMQLRYDIDDKSYMRFMLAPKVED